MRNFTKTEVDLCKKIAEKDKRKLKCGDYMVVNGEVDLFDTKWGECPNRFPDAPAVYNCSDDMYHKDYFPLWQEHDCLEWLRQEHESILIQYIWRGWNVIISKSPEGRNSSYTWQGKTPLEALLHAVLAILEKK